jgi:hypothetical protein
MKPSPVRPCPCRGNKSRPTGTWTVPAIIYYG